MNVQLWIFEQNWKVQVIVFHNKLFDIVFDKSHILYRIYQILDVADNTAKISRVVSAKYPKRNEWKLNSITTTKNRLSFDFIFLCDSVNSLVFFFFLGSLTIFRRWRGAPQICVFYSLFEKPLRPPTIIMEVDDEEFETPTSSSKGDKKRFEVKKVRGAKSRSPLSKS